MRKSPIYLDYMATTPIDEHVVKAMLGFMGKEGAYGNPASLHLMGQTAMAAVDKARQQVAAAINAVPDDIVWTSGATEANNLAIKGAAQFYRRKGNHLITLKTEHKAVLDCFGYLERNGFEVTYLASKQDGLIDIDALERAITDSTILISVMHVNNEIGVIQPVAEIAQRLKGRGIIFHVDAAQSIGKVAVDIDALGVDLMSFSAHKVYGPKGIGALYVRSRPRVRLEPQLHGGGHERGLRSGTLATHQIVGMGEAFELAQANLELDRAHYQRLFEKLLHALLPLGGVHLNGSLAHRVYNNLSLSFEGVDGESLVYALSDLCVSTASACVSASIEPSYVLKNLGLADRLAHSTIRLSLGRYTTEEEVDVAIKLITSQVKRLREMFL